MTTPTTRRCALTLAAGVCSAPLAGCAGYGAQQQPRASGPSSGTRATGGAPALARVDDIPVGGGSVFADDGVVVTRPDALEVRVLSAVCTHAGCQVASVDAEGIHCPCHGSVFSLTGEVSSGPAPSPLAAVPATVTGGEIRLS